MYLQSRTVYSNWNKTHGELFKQQQERSGVDLRRFFLANYYLLETKGELLKCQINAIRAKGFLVFASTSPYVMNGRIKTLSLVVLSVYSDYWGLRVADMLLLGEKLEGEGWSRTVNRKNKILAERRKKGKGTA